MQFLNYNNTTCVLFDFMVMVLYGHCTVDNQFQVALRILHPGWVVCIIWNGYFFYTTETDASSDRDSRAYSIAVSHTTVDYPPSSSSSPPTMGMPSSFFSFGSLLVAWSLQSPSVECFSSSGLPGINYNSLDTGKYHSSVWMSIYTRAVLSMCSSHRKHSK